jgi:hypothetical protein
LEIVGAYAAAVDVPLPENFDMASWTPDDDPFAEDARWTPINEGEQWISVPPLATAPQTAGGKT